MKTNPDTSAIFNLEITERLQLVEDLWDSIASNSDSVPIHSWQKKELQRRKINHLKDPGSGSSWDEVKKRIRNKHAP